MTSPALMRTLRACVTLAAIAGVLPDGALHAKVVRFHTTSGNIDVRLYDGAAPLHVQNFLNYTTSNRYDATFIHRVPQLQGGGTADFVVQGGGFKLNNSIFAATEIALDPPVPLEFAVSNLRGTLGAARTLNPVSAQSQWFFNVGDNTHLDSPGNEFTVFGRVVGGGMSVVDAINDLSIIDASAAQNAPREAFSEVPIYNLQKVLTQQDVRDDDAVIVQDIEVLSFTDGDYNFDGFVNDADLAVWTANIGSTTKAEADGNGNGVIDQADFLIWQANVPEPNSLGLAAAVGLAAPISRRRLGLRR